MALLTESTVSGRIRLGATEEYAALYLPGILKSFGEKFPLIQVNIYCDSSTALLKLMDRGKLDICLKNSGSNESYAEFLREEPLVWVGPKDNNPEEQSPLPVAVFNEGCINRQWGLEALKKENIDYRIAYTSPSISGILAAVRSGLAVAPIGASTLTSYLRVIPSKVLPSLPSTKICLYHSNSDKKSTQASLVQHIIDEFCVLNRGQTPIVLF